MAQATAAIINKPAWVDLSSSDAAGLARLLCQGLRLEGGGQSRSPVRRVRAGASSVTRMPPGSARPRTPDARRPGTSTSGRATSTALATKVQAAGGTVIAPPFDVGDQGRMAVFQDPSGAIISAWQGARMGGFQTDVRELLRLGRAERPRRRQGAPVLQRRSSAGR